MQNVAKDILNAVPDQVADLFPDVRGMTTPKVRYFLNKLVSQLPKEEGYLEIGIHQGGTLIPALAGHREVDATACDNWSQFEALTEGSAKDFFYKNLAKHAGQLPSVRVVDFNVWEFLKNPDFKKPLGIVFYDGDHREEDQRQIFTAIYPHLAQESILIIDDYDHPPVKAGSEKGIKDKAWKTVDFVYRSRETGYHNGMGVFHLTK